MLVILFAPALGQAVLANLGNLSLFHAAAGDSSAQFDRATRLLEKANLVGKPRIAIYRNLAYAYESLAEPMRLQDAVERGLSMTPSDPLLLYRAGIMYYADGDVDAAVTAWTRAQAGTWFFYRATEYYNQGNTDEALVNLGLAAAIAPHISDPHFLQGTIHERQGRWEEAEVAYRAAVQRNAFLWDTKVAPHVRLATAYARLGYSTYQASGNLEQALESLEMAVKLNSDPWAFMFLCDIYRRAGEPILAIEWGNRAVSQVPNQHWPYYYRGSAYMDAGDYQRAQQDLERALTIAPSYQPARSRLERLSKMLSETSDE